MKKEKVNFLQVCFAIAGRYSEFKITSQLFCYGTYVQDISMFKIIQSFNEKGETTVLHQQSESLKNISEFIFREATDNLQPDKSSRSFFRYFNDKDMKIVF